METKPYAIIRILQLLYHKTNADNRLTHNKIAEILHNDYGISIDRKSIGAKIAILKKTLSGEDEGDGSIVIKTSSTGTYISSRLFSDAELSLLIDTVWTSDYLSASGRAKMIEKLCKLSDDSFCPAVKSKEISRNTQEFTNMLNNVEIIMKAIEEKVAIKFTYLHSDFDRKPMLPGYEHTVYPYRFILHGQHYYLIAYNGERHDYTAFHVDHITNIAKLTTPLTSSLRCDVFDKLLYRPFIFCDEDVRVEFILRDRGLMDNVMDTFGSKFTTQAIDSTSVKISLNTSELAMKKWALQNLDAVEVTYPKRLREEIKKTIADSTQKYQ